MKGAQKKLAVYLVVLALCVSLSGAAVSGNVAKADTSSDEQWEYSVNGDGTVTITKYMGSDMYLIVPSTIDDMYVTGIGNEAFYNNGSLNAVIIPDNILTIGNFAFALCGNLTEIVMSDKTLSIGEGAFLNCSSLTGITLPATLQRIEKDTFSGCTSLREIAIPAYVTTIGDTAFYGCSNLQKVSIPEGTVTGIGNSAFSLCKSLSDIAIPASVTSIGAEAFYYCESINEMTLSDSVAFIGADAFTGCSSSFTINTTSGSYAEIYAKDNNINVWTPDAPGIKNFEYSENSDGTITITGYIGEETDIVIPQMISGKVVNSIGEKAFYSNTFIKRVTIPSGITNIGAWSFAYCYELEEVSLPESLVSIGESAFLECMKLSILSEIPKGVYAIGEDAFGCTAVKEYRVSAENLYYASYSGVLYSYDKTTLINYPSGCTNEEFVVPDSVITIGRFAFSRSTFLKRITIPSSVKIIKWSAFSACTGLKQVFIPSSVISMEGAVFSYCTNLEEVVLPEGLAAIGQNFFMGCERLKGIKLPESVREIGYAAFWDCSSLQELVLPEGFYYIGERAFLRCSSLISITIPVSTFNIDTTAFEGCYNLVIYTMMGAYAETFARVNGISVRLLNEPTPSPTPSPTPTPTPSPTPTPTPTLTPSPTPKITPPPITPAPAITVPPASVITVPPTIPPAIITPVPVITAPPVPTEKPWEDDSDAEEKAIKDNLKLSSITVGYTAVKSKGIFYKTAVKITWQKKNSARGYMIYRSTDGGKYSCLADIESGNRVAYTDKKVVKGKKYRYKVQAYTKTVDNWYYGSYSPAKTIKVSKKLLKPTISYTKKGKELTILFKKVEGTNYQSQYRYLGTKKWSTLSKLKGKLCPKVSKVIKFKGFQFRIRTYMKIDGKKCYSEWSKEITIK